MTSRRARQTPLFMRNSYETTGQWGIPLVKKDTIPLDNLRMMSVDHIKKTDRANCDMSIHFFTDDYKMEKFYNRPFTYACQLAQYSFVCTPDYSLYVDTPLAQQIHNVFKNRWCGAYWQDVGLKVVPTVSWSTEESYSFCFDGIEKRSVVAISTYGAMRDKFIGKTLFLHGFERMMALIEPTTVICYYQPFPEMTGPILSIDPQFLINKRRAS
jgi:hypothetical protein